MSLLRTSSEFSSAIIINLFILVTDGSSYLDLVEIGTVDKSFHFSYVAGESVNTVWQGIKTR